MPSCEYIMSTICREKNATLECKKKKKCPSILKTVLNFCVRHCVYRKSIILNGTRIHFKHTFKFKRFSSDSTTSWNRNNQMARMQTTWIFDLNQQLGRMPFIRWRHSIPCTTNFIEWIAAHYSDRIGLRLHYVHVCFRCILKMKQNEWRRIAILTNPKTTCTWVWWSRKRTHDQSKEKRTKRKRFWSICLTKLPSKELWAVLVALPLRHIFKLIFWTYKICTLEWHVI